MIRSGKSRSAGKKNAELLREIEELRARLEGAEATIQAIQTGGVDALLVSGPDGEKVFALEGADYPYRVIVDVMNEGVVTLGADGDILSCNSRFANFVQMPVEQILGKPLLRFATTEDVPILRAFLKEAAGKGGVVTTTMVLVDGTTKHVNFSVGAFEVGGLPALCIVVTDLTEIFAATETRLRLASIVETSNDAIISKSLDDTILTWNAAAERIFGFSAQEAVGQPVSIIVSPDRLQESKMIDEKAYLGQRIEGYETTRSTKSGASIEISLTVSRLMEANGKVTGISIIARDITERKRAKDALLQARDRLEERVAKRTHELDATNKALESYSHSVSHDLRTPLRFVNRITHMLLHDPEANLSNAAVQQVNMILQATGEMAKLIEKLLVFSQVSRETIIKNRVDLRRLFQGVVKELRHVQVDRSVDIVIQNLAPCHGDRTLLKEVVANLLENAFKFTRRREIARITVGCTETTAETVYFVQDNGVGFDMSNADSLFVPFHRLHKPDDFEGTGIGLALVKRIIERHGGRVWAEGEVDKGATFYFTLGKETPEGYTTKLKEAND